MKLDEHIDLVVELDRMERRLLQILRDMSVPPDDETEEQAAAWDAYNEELWELASRYRIRAAEAATRDHKGLGPGFTHNNVDCPCWHREEKR